MHGDQVLVELIRKKDDGRAEGRILRVLTRGNPTVVGTFHRGARQNYVTPIDEKVTQQIVIPRGMEWPEGWGTHAERDRVLGKEARQGEWGDLEGVVVEVEITDWPSPTENPRGRVLEILGYEDDFGVDVEIIIRKFHLPHHFPVEVLQEAQQFDGVIFAGQMQHRRDYRPVPIVTIDGETARDFDDAVTVRRLSNGNFELQVHIADVAHYVREGSSIDLEARLRGTSVYFPDRAVPMLPIELSTDMCSLRPQVERMVLSCVMEIDHQGEIVGYTLSEGVIRSAERMTYTNVNLILEGDAALREHYHKLVDVFELMRELAHGAEPQAGAARLHRLRPAGAGDRVRRARPDEEHRALGAQHRQPHHRGVHAVGQRVRGQLSGEQGRRVAVSHPREARSQAGDGLRDYRRQVRLFAGRGRAAGEAGAVQSRAARTLRHWQPRKDAGDSGGSTHHAEDVSEADAEDCGQAGGAHPVVPDAAVAEAGAVLGEERRAFRAGRVDVYAFHFADPAVSGFDCASHIEGCVARVGGAGRTWSAGGGGRDCGSGGTSVAVVEETHPWIANKRRQGGARPGCMRPIAEDELHQIAEESSQAERRADEAERELMEWKKMKFMEERVGDDFDGLIVSVTKFGMFVELNDMFIEGLVPLASLSDDQYLYHENTRQIIGQRSRKTYSLGDPIRVLVDRIDRMQRRIQFAVVEERPVRKRGKKR